MSKLRRRQRCPKCGSLDIIRWGIRNNHQRYKCSNCGSSFIRKQPTVSSANRFIWFRKWVLGKQTIQYIAEVSGYSERSFAYIDSDTDKTSRINYVKNNNLIQDCV